MARNLYILETGSPDDLFLFLRVVLRVPVTSPAAQAALADPNAESALPDATASELDDLRAGRVLELVEAVRWTDVPSEKDITTQLTSLARNRARQRMADAGLTAGRPQFFTAGMSYDATLDLWTGGS